MVTRAMSILGAPFEYMDNQYVEHAATLCSAQKTKENKNFGLTYKRKERACQDSSMESSDP